jgi:hypothetical protein
MNQLSHGVQRDRRKLKSDVLSCQVHERLEIIA